MPEACNLSKCVLCVLISDMSNVASRKPLSAVALATTAAAGKPAAAHSCAGRGQQELPGAGREERV